MILLVVLPFAVLRGYGIISVWRGKPLTKLEYSFKNDILFKMVFVKYPNLLKRLVAELLDI